MTVLTTNYSFKKEALGHPERDTTIGDNLDLIDTAIKGVSDTVGDFGPLASAKVVVGDSEGAAAAVDMSGDITIGNTGVTTIGADKVTKTEIAADVAGDGLAQAVGGELEVGVDDSTVELNTDKVRIKDLGVTIAKLEAALIKGIATVPLSFETDELTATKIYFPFKVTVTKIRSIVMKAIGATADATVTGNNGTGDTVVTIAAESALNTEDSADPSAANGVVEADAAYTLTSAKGATAGGKALVTLEYTRTA